MKLFYHLFGYLLLGTVILIGTDEYIGLLTEVEQFETDMRTNAIQYGQSISGIIAHTWRENGEETAKALLQDANENNTISVRWVWIRDLLTNQQHKANKRFALQQLENGETASLISLDPDDERRLYTYVPVDVGEQRKGVLELRQTLVPLTNFTYKMVIRYFIQIQLLE